MGTLSVTLPSDGQTIDAADYNTPINTIVSEINGSLDSDNIANSGVVPNSVLDGTGTSWVWQDWTPTFTNFTKGSASITAKYIQIGKTVHFRLQVTLAADSSMGTSPTFSLPVTSVSYGTANISCIGIGTILDNGTQTYKLLCNWASTTTAQIGIMGPSGSYIIDVAVTSTVPMTWTTNDKIAITGTYEAA